MRSVKSATAIAPVPVDRDTALLRRQQAELRLRTAEMDEKQAEMAQLQHEARLRRVIEQEFAAAHFRWYALMETVFPILRYEGWVESSGWRGRRWSACATAALPTASRRRPSSPRPATRASQWGTRPC